MRKPMTKKKYIEGLELDLIEIYAYRQLQSEGFDFRYGYISNDKLQSEDAYFKMEQLDLEELYEYETELLYQINMYHIHRNIRLNRHARKAITQQKLKRQMGNGNWQVWFHDNGKFLVKSTGGAKVKRWVKKQSRKKIRKSKIDFPLKGNGFHKIFDYFWELD